ncbi:hypothetical protein DUNSADRAFT_17228 [Dunaliella salina]|uniref:Uncharacterized protein n=1 Tax=Dunaliella salina TaxID=3046 RepID=A0ABQ7G233_DUNSA|nr:hypothetical protein DUNSADRAFT_17228 [Dunaliella salina]|eukprot:KAF5828668.1 hypothetical protein DUNSADRAFT_17228 [Dunaliella salina]
MHHRSLPGHLAQLQQLQQQQHLQPQSVSRLACKRRPGRRRRCLAASRKQQQQQHAAVAAASDGHGSIQPLEPVKPWEPQKSALLYDPAHAPTLEEFSSIEFSELSPKQLAGSIWSFAKQGTAPSRDLMDAIAAEVHSKLGQFRSQDLSNTLWALAVLRYQPSTSWWEAFENQVGVLRWGNPEHSWKHLQ